MMKVSKPSAFNSISIRFCDGQVSFGLSLSTISTTVSQVVVFPEGIHYGNGYLYKKPPDLNSP